MRKIHEASHHCKGNPTFTYNTNKGKKKNTNTALRENDLFIIMVVGAENTAEGLS